MTTTDILVAAVVAMAITAAIVLIMPLETTPRVASAQQAANCVAKQDGQLCEAAPVDKINCQYPTRWSNPAGGCDNSDPAAPECIKEFSTKQGEDACIAALTADQDKQLNPEQVTEPAQYGGK